MTIGRTYSLAAMEIVVAAEGEQSQTPTPKGTRVSDDYHMAEQAWLSLQETAPQRARLGGLKGEGGRE